MAKTFTREQVMAMLKQRQGERTMTALAQEFGVTKAYISDLFIGRRDPGLKILKPLGLERKITVITEYRRIA